MAAPPDGEVEAGRNPVDPRDLEPGVEAARHPGDDAEPHPAVDGRRELGAASLRRRRDRRTRRRFGRVRDRRGPLVIDGRGPGIGRTLLGEGGEQRRAGIRRVGPRGRGQVHEAPGGVHGQGDGEHDRFIEPATLGWARAKRAAAEHPAIGVEDADARLEAPAPGEGLDGALDESVGGRRQHPDGAGEDVFDGDREGGHPDASLRSGTPRPGEGRRGRCVRRLRRHPPGRRRRAGRGDQRSQESRHPSQSSTAGRKF